MILIKLHLIYYNAIAAAIYYYLFIYIYATFQNLDNAKEVNDYLKYISKHYGGLICNICGVRWNYVKKYLKHISECVGIF